MKEIKMPCGRVALVDDEDFDVMSALSWHVNKDGYAQRQPGGRVGRKTILMHRAIMGLETKQRVDHKNLNRLDNRKENLRFATKSQNQWNRGLSRANKTGFKRVFRHPHGRYSSSIGVFGKTIYLGMFSTPEEAHAAYVEAAKKHHGDFCRIK